MAEKFVCRGGCPLNHTVDIDWQALVLAIRAEGLSIKGIARRTGVSEYSIGFLSRGEVKEPRFGLGIALLELHLTMCPERHATVIYGHV